MIATFGEEEERIQMAAKGKLTIPRAEYAKARALAIANELGVSDDTIPNRIHLYAKLPEFIRYDNRLSASHYPLIKTHFNSGSSPATLTV